MNNTRMNLNSICMRYLLVLLVAGASLAAFRCEARAETSGGPPSRWAVARLQGIMTLPLGENHVEAWNDCGGAWPFDYLSFGSTIDVNSSGGVIASFEYVLKRRYGIEVGFMYWRKIMDLQFEASEFTVEGCPNFIMPTIGVNYHLVTDEKKDIYGGALCALGVIATGVSADMEVSKDIALGVTLGADYYVKAAWSIGAAVKYVDFGEIDFSLFPPGVEGLYCDNGLFGLGRMNVVTLICGVGYRF